jgi:hypothetical protein
MQAKFEKNKAKGKLSPVEIEKGNVDLTKQQLKIKEAEEDLAKAQKKLKKLR